MRKPIFESEEEFDNFTKFVIECMMKNGVISESIIKTAAKQDGYIRRSPVEEAEEIIKEFEYCKYHPEGQIVEIRSSDCVKVYEGFNLLKKQLEEK